MQVILKSFNSSENLTVTVTEALVLRPY